MDNYRYERKWATSPTPPKSIRLNYDDRREYRIARLGNKSSSLEYQRISCTRFGFVVLYAYMAYMDNEAPNFDTEQGRGALHNPRIATLLGSAGLTAVDLQFFDGLHDYRQSVFVHGSIMADRLTPTSDVDFTVVGEFNDISPDLRDFLMPGLIAARGLHQVDYVSTAIRSQHGRKVSLHMSEPSFRENYPTTEKPFATEFRPSRHAKSGDRKYFLPGIDQSGNIHLVDFLCRSDRVGQDGSTLTDIPQTGLMVLNGKSIYIDDKEKTNIIANQVIKIRPDEELDSETSDYSTEVMMLGLEFDKMQSDTLMYNNSSSDIESERRFVHAPSRRSLEAVGEFAELDPTVVIQQLFGALAKYWPQIRPHKSR